MHECRHDTSNLVAGATIEYNLLTKPHQTFYHKLQQKLSHRKLMKKKLKNKKLTIENFIKQLVNLKNDRNPECKKYHL